MVIPVLYPDVDSVKGYLPPSATWYSLSDDRFGREIPAGNSEFPAPRHKHLPVFVRAGHVLPRQVPAVTTSAARLNEFQLLVALEHSSGVSTAFGELYWDDGESVVTDFDRHDFYHFTFNVTVDHKQTTIVIHADRVPTQSALILPRLGELEFFGYDARPNLGVATLNGDHVHVNLHYVTYDASDKVLRMALLQGTADLINLNKGGPTWTLSWVNNVKTDL
ncbi:Protein AAGR-2 [Aphelenchoides avenae]|nr:Protein AAGR-2 [Aphelenchus avenae]